MITTGDLEQSGIPLQHRDSKVRSGGAALIAAAFWAFSQTLDNRLTML